MAISFRCESCDHPLRVSDEKAGKRIRCPECDEVNKVPAAGGAKEDRVKSGAPAAKKSKPAKEEPPKPSLPQVDLEKGYGLFVDPKLEEERLKRVAEEEKRAKENAKKKAPKLERRRKTIYDTDLWKKVNVGLMFILIGVAVWGLVFLLNAVCVLFSCLDGPQYASLIPKFLLAENQPPLEIGQLQAMTRVRFSIAMFSGEGYYDLVSTFLIINQVLLLAMGGLWLTGFGFMASVPARFGTKLQVKVLFVLGFINLLFILVFKLLPLVGAYDWNLTTLQIPEVAMGGSNVERLFPAHLHWMHHPFFEIFLTVLVQFVFYLEPVLIGVFLWSCGKSLRDDWLEGAGEGLVEICLGCYFLTFAYLMVSMCGSSEVLLWLLRIIYFLWTCFTLGYLIAFALRLLKARQLLTLLVTDTEAVEEESGGKMAQRQAQAGKKSRKDEEEDDDEDDDDRDEDDEEE